MLQVLDDEKIIILHPKEKKGYDVSISGISDNFQLTFLLMKHLIGDSKKGYLSKSIFDENDFEVAMATSSQSNDSESIIGLFNLWNWKGLCLEGFLPEGKDAMGDNIEHWIWGEGIPKDIVPFEGTRVVLLGKPPYKRSFTSSKIFPNMEPTFTVNKILSENEVEKWVEKIKKHCKK